MAEHSELVVDPTLEALWKRVLDSWTDDAAHGAFLDYCQRSGRLVEAAVRYRGMTGDRDRGPSAQKRLQGVTVLALASLEASRTPAPRARARTGSWLLVAAFVAATALLLAYLRLTQ